MSNKERIIFFAAVSFLFLVHGGMAAPNACDAVQAQLLRRMNDTVSQLVLRRTQQLANLSAYEMKASVANCVYTSDSDTDNFYVWRQNHAVKVAKRAMYFSTTRSWISQKHREMNALVLNCQNTCKKTMGKILADKYCTTMSNAIDQMMEIYPVEFEGCDLSL